MSRTRLRILLVGAAAAVLPAWCPAGHVTNYFADLRPLNGSGVSGRADLRLEGDLLTVRITASGLEPGMVHPQHIHGRFGDAGEPIDSVTPPPSADNDGDGFVELAEGLPFYGPVLLSLTSPPGAGLAGFPTAAGGTIDFLQIYDLTDSGIFPAGISAADLMPLVFREIVLHGMTVGNVGDGTGGEVNGVAGYKAVLPVAAGEIQAAPVPEPGTLALLGTGAVGLFGGWYRKRRKTTVAA